MEEQMPKKSGKYSSKGMLAPSSEVEIKQPMNAKTRYSGMLASESEIVMKQAQNAKDTRY